MLCIRGVTGLTGKPVSGSTRPWKTSRRSGAVAAVVALFAAMAFISAGQASASLVSGVSIAEHFPLQSNVDVPPGVRVDKPPGDGFVHHVSFILENGQSRRVSDQLTVTLNGSNRWVEVDNNIECFDPEQPNQPLQTVGVGTNHPASGSGSLSMRASLIFTAPHTGTFDCWIQAVTSDGTNTKYHMTALADTSPLEGTWLELDNFTNDPPSFWHAPDCPSDDKDGRCIYLRRVSPTPPTAVLYEDGPTWTATPDAVTADLEAHMQITSCYCGTGSCPPKHWGDCFDANPTAVFRTHIDIIQLDPSEQPCQVTSTDDLQYAISNDVHHFLVDYGRWPTGLISISAACGGSRTFKLRGVVTSISGNPVKIDDGVATNASVIVRSTAPTTTVPPVIGTDEGSVAGHLAAAGLTVGAVTRVVNPVRPGTVIGQNSPAGTVEPVRSPVNLTVSLGAVTVPPLDSFTIADAADTLSGIGLTVDISYQRACIDPGRVIGQTPSGGAVLAPGSSVHLTVDSGTKCGPPK
jgi:hypothetical protein